MTLTNKQKALAATVGLFAGSVVMAYIVKFIFANVSAEVLGMALGAFLLYMFATLIYQLMLHRFEYEESVSKLVDKK